MKTSKGYQIAYLNRCTYQTQGFEGFSGRVRVVSDDPYHDVVVRWDSNSQPIGHEYGSIVRKGSRAEIVDGFNLFSDLIGSGK